MSGSLCHDVSAQISRGRDEKSSLSLGKTAKRYHVCHNSSETERVGYCYVDYPTGDYCGAKP